jgi:hypothetical protein
MTSMGWPPPSQTAGGVTRRGSSGGTQTFALKLNPGSHAGPWSIHALSTSTCLGVS